MPIEIKGNCLDLRFDYVRNLSKGGDDLILTITSLGPGLYGAFRKDEKEGDFQIRITGEQESKDFIRACAFFWEDFTRETGESIFKPKDFTKV